MPTYDYLCESCGHQYEAFQSMTDEVHTICPECGKEIKRLISGGMGVIFKGSGYYINDSKKAPAAAPSCKNGGCNGNCGS